jgi:hypothetical protein
LVGSRRTSLSRFGEERDEGFVWFWIGGQVDYEKFLK